MFITLDLNVFHVSSLVVASPNLNSLNAGLTCKVRAGSKEIVSELPVSRSGIRTAGIGTKFFNLVDES